MESNPNEKTIINNSFDKVRLLVGGIGEIIFISLYFFLTETGNYGPTIILLLFIIILPIIIVYMDIIHRPTVFIIDDEGFTLQFRFTNPSYVKYDDITWVALDIPQNHDGGFGVRGKIAYRASPKICGLIRQKYYIKKGTFPKEYQTLS